MSSKDEGWPQDPFLRSVYAALIAFPGRLSSRRAARLAAEQVQVELRVAREAIKRLVTAGALRFVNDCGVSYLEENFLGFCRLSERVFISTLAAQSEPEAVKTGRSVVVRLSPGIAFGDCRHATTRLSIRALDEALGEHGRQLDLKTGLDLGTGSGVLALVAVRLGVSAVVAVDIDQCARKEARENVALNGLDNRSIQVRDLPLPETPAGFAVISANLRPPTLKAQAAMISENAVDRGLVILSGMRQEEVADVLASFQATFDLIRKETEDNWCALVLQRIKRSPK